MASGCGRAGLRAGVPIFISRFITLSASAGPFTWFALLAANFTDFLVFGFGLFLGFFPH